MSEPPFQFRDAAFIMIDDGTEDQPERFGRFVPSPLIDRKVLGDSRHAKRVANPADIVKTNFGKLAGSGRVRLRHPLDKRSCFLKFSSRAGLELVIKSNVIPGAASPHGKRL